MEPTIGRIVHYRLTAEQAKRVNDTRDKQVITAIGVRNLHHGNYAGEGDVLPLIVTAVWPKEYDGSPSARLAEHPEGTMYESTFGVNGQALLDGNDSLWVTSAPQHTTLPGCWFWPPKV